jgi:hypothetical protein
VRYFFHCRLGGEQYPDWSGMHLPGEAEALAEGARIARELGAEQDYAGAIVTVTTATGEEIGRFTVVYPSSDNG